MVELHLLLKAPPGRRRETLEALRTLRFPARLDRGCAAIHLFCELDDPDLLCYVEEWPECEDLIREVQSERFSRLMALMETAAERPVLEFRFVQETRGLDYVEQVRAGTPTHQGRG